MEVGFIGLGAMGALIVPRLMAAGHSVTGWNRSRDKAAALIDAGHDMGGFAARGRRTVRDRVLDRDRRRGGARGRARRRRRAQGPARGRHLCRHEHDRARREPRGRGGIRQGRPLHARLADLRQPGHGRGRQCLGHGRRRCGRVRARQARDARDRPEGDAYRRQRPGLPDEDRRQPAADGRGDRVRRGDCARREGRRQRARSRSMRC